MKLSKKWKMTLGVMGTVAIAAVTTATAVACGNPAPSVPKASAITNTMPKTIYVGESQSFTITAPSGWTITNVGAENGDVTVASGNNSGSYTIKGVTASTKTGVQVTLQNVNNTNDTGTVDFPVTVASAPTVPTEVTNTLPSTVYVGAPAQSFTVTAPTGWTIESVTSSNTTDATISGSDGSYTIKGLVAGSLNVTVTLKSADPAQKNAKIEIPVTVANAPAAPKLSSVISGLPSTIYVGAPAQSFTVTTPAGWKVVSVTSSNTADATVTGSGSSYTIKAVEEGSATVQVTLKNIADPSDVQTIKSSAVTVANAPAAPKLSSVISGLPSTIYVGAPAQSFTVTAPTGWTIESVTSSNTTDATISGSDGSYTIKGLVAGSLNVTVTLKSADPAQKNAKIEIPVTVANAPAAPKLSSVISGLPSTIYVGAPAQSFTVTTPAGWKVVSVTSSNTADATVTGSGSSYTIKAVEEGSATVQVTLKNIADPSDVQTIKSSAVTVANAPAAPKLSSVISGLPSTIYVGAPAQSFTVTTPAGWKVVSVTSSNTADATVTGSGSSYTIKAVEEGSATVQVTLKNIADPSDVQTIKSSAVTVANAPAAPKLSSVISGLPSTIYVGAPAQSFTVTIPQGWTIDGTVSSTADATVTGSGSSWKIKAAKAGSATVQVTLKNVADPSDVQTISATVTVKAAPTKPTDKLVTLSKSSVAKGSPETITIQGIPSGWTVYKVLANNDDITVQYSSGDTSFKITGDKLTSASTTTGIKIILKSADSAQPDVTLSYSITVSAPSHQPNPKSPKPDKKPDPGHPKFFALFQQTARSSYNSLALFSSLFTFLK